MNRLIYSLSISISLAGIIVFTGAMSGCTTKQTVTPTPIPTPPIESPATTQPSPVITPTEPIATPTPTPEPTPTPTSTPVETPTPTPSPIPNPVEEYAKNLGLSDDLIKLLEPLGTDNEINKTDKLIVDNTKEISQLNISDNATRNNIAYLLSKPSKFLDAYNLLKAVSDNASRDYLELGIDDNVIDYVSFVSSLTDKDFAKYALANKLCIQDKNLTDLKRNFLKEPEKYKQQMFDYNLSEIQKLNPELAMELKNIPDFIQIDIKDVEASEDIADLSKYRSVFGTSFSSMFEEGIKDKRKYCSPIQALTWIMFDFDKEYIEREKLWEFSYKPKPNIKPPNRDPPLFNMVGFSWEKSSTSGNYQSDRWKKFEDVVPRLNSPNLVSIYMKKQIKYEAEPPGQFIDQIAIQTFNLKKGDCEDIGMFSAWCLGKNGYESYVIKIWPKGKQIGHAVGLYKENKDIYTIYLDIIRGPFKTIDETAESVYKDWGIYKLYDLNWNQVY